MPQPTLQPSNSPFPVREAINAYLERCHRRKYRAKSTIIRQGEPAMEMFYLISGSVTVLVEDHKGREIVLAYLNAGDFFGELGFFNEKVNRAALVRARTPCEVGILSYDGVRQMHDLLPGLLCAINAQLATRLRKMNRKFSNLAFMDVSGRIARTLLDLGREPDAMSHPDGRLIRITRQELGRVVGCSREMVGRVLRELEDREFISVHGKSIILHNPL